ncbi:uncharacterized protein [Rutidosis leptorrhynchoides]|uniref:uncharacterized protein n=1 Tax=Rutidosis leptorrhynchoides TaxID=125765 RepID=UPI003A9A5608
MADLKEANSPLCHRIVRSYFNYLDSAEPRSVSDDEAYKYVLSDVMSSYASSTVNDPIDSNNPVNSKTSEASQTLGDTDEHDPVRELFFQFRETLKKGRYFQTTQNEVEVEMQTAWMFEGALEILKKSGISELNFQNMADTFKFKGNTCMEKKWYTDAIGHYTAAIALFDNNAVYYCNRAAAYTKDEKYTEAIFDSLKAVAIDPSYSKAYNRLGFAYHAQGNYMDAIEKGYKKALELDPNNETIKGNIQKALSEEKGADDFSVDEVVQSSSKNNESGSSSSSSSSQNSRNHPQFDLDAFAFQADSLNSMSPEKIKSLFEDEPQDPITESEVELLAQFGDALEKACFFPTTLNEFEVKLQTAWMFESALQELKNSGVWEFDLQKMADTFKLKGNKCMGNKFYTDAIGHYSAAIALFNDNAVYYCNRAAAFTRTKQYTEAKVDCFKAVAIDPSYSKAYSRLGFAYHAEEYYVDAIKSYKKALELDQDNETIKGNLRASEKKLMEKLGSVFQRYGLVS